MTSSRKFWLRGGAVVPHLFILLVSHLLLLHHEYSCVVAEGPVFMHDLRPTLSIDAPDAYETVQAVSAIQGIVNRNAATLFVNYTSADVEWLSYTKSTGWLAGRPTIVLDSIVDVVKQFSGQLSGVALYDPNVPATSNVAATAAGTRSLVPVCYRPGKGTVYTQLVASGLLKVQLDLVGKFNGSISGSAKNDAYRWAITEFISSGETDPGFLAYYVDYFWTYPGVYSKNNNFHTNKVSNHDYFVMKKAFFFDLDFWADEAPNDDPHQPIGTDRATVQLMLEACNKQLHNNGLIWVGGFTPWAFKYVDAKHGGVPTEWETARILSQYNAFLDADACCVGGFANAAFWSKFPLADRYHQNPAPQPSELESKGYMSASGSVADFNFVSFYVGDFDSAAWLNSQMWGLWNDPERGSIPMGWAVDPQLSDRFPPVFHLMYSTLTGNDFITTGDSGAGYLNPTGLFDRPMSGLPSGATAWRNHNRQYFTKFGLSFTGFIINGASGSMTTEAQELYTSFSWDGMTDQTGYPPSHSVPYLQGNTPVFTEIDLPSDPSQAAQTILKNYQSGRRFQVYRSVLQGPSYHKAIVDAVASSNANIKFVDPLSLGYLARTALGGNNNDRVVYLDDTIPRTMSAGGSGIPFTVTVRNQGWNTLATGPAAPNATKVMIQYTMGPCNGVAFADADFTPGSSMVFSGTFTPPKQAGPYLMAYQLRRGWDDTGDFDNLGNPAWFADITVT